MIVRDGHYKVATACRKPEARVLELGAKNGGLGRKPLDREGWL